MDEMPPILARILVCSSDTDFLALTREAMECGEWAAIGYALGTLHNIDVGWPSLKGILDPLGVIA